VFLVEIVRSKSLVMTIVQPLLEDSNFILLHAFDEALAIEFVTLLLSILETMGDDETASVGSIFRLLEILTLRGPHCKVFALHIHECCALVLAGDKMASTALSQFLAALPKSAQAEPDSNAPSVASVSSPLPLAFKALPITMNAAFRKPTMPMATFLLHLLPSIIAAQMNDPLLSAQFSGHDSDTDKPARRVSLSLARCIAVDSNHRLAHARSLLIHLLAPKSASTAAFNTHQFSTIALMVDLIKALNQYPQVAFHSASEDAEFDLAVSSAPSSAELNVTTSVASAVEFSSLHPEHPLVHISGNPTTKGWTCRGQCAGKTHFGNHHGCQTCDFNLCSACWKSSSVAPKSAAGTAKSPPAFRPHLGTWRSVQAANKPACSTALSPDGPVCLHGESIIAANHWSCCGLLEYFSMCSKDENKACEISSASQPASTSVAPNTGTASFARPIIAAPVAASARSVQSPLLSPKRALRTLLYRAIVNALRETAQLVDVVRRATASSELAMFLALKDATSPSGSLTATAANGKREVASAMPSEFVDETTGQTLQVPTLHGASLVSAVKLLRSFVDAISKSSLDGVPNVLSTLLIPRAKLYHATAEADAIAPPQVVAPMPASMAGRKQNSAPSSSVGVAAATADTSVASAPPPQPFVHRLRLARGIESALAELLRLPDVVATQLVDCAAHCVLMSAALPDGFTATGGASLSLARPVVDTALALIDVFVAQIADIVSKGSARPGQAFIHNSGFASRRFKDAMWLLGNVASVPHGRRAIIALWSRLVRVGVVAAFRFASSSKSSASTAQSQSQAQSQSYHRISPSLLLIGLMGSFSNAAKLVQSVSVQHFDSLLTNETNASVIRAWSDLSAPTGKPNAPTAGPRIAAEMSRSFAAFIDRSLDSEVTLGMLLPPPLSSVDFGSGGSLCDSSGILRVYRLASSSYMSTLSAAGIDSIFAACFDASTLRMIASLPAARLAAPQWHRFSAHETQTACIQRLVGWLASALQLLWSSPPAKDASSPAGTSAVASPPPSSFSLSSASEFSRAYSQRLLQRLLRARTAGAALESKMLTRFLPFPNAYD
jgi:hypothetical protein